LDRVSDFVTEPAGPRILTVLGDPGAGKTAVLARIAREFGALHFFFGRSDGLRSADGGGWSEPIRCAETIVTQLQASYGDDVFDACRWGIEVDLNIRSAEAFVAPQIKRFNVRPHSGPTARVSGTVGLKDASVPAGLVIHELRIDPMMALQELVLAPLRRAACKTSRSVILVLDALDEWDQVSCPTDLLELLAAADLPSNVKVVASARPAYASTLADESIVIDISGGDRSEIDHDVAQLVEHFAQDHHIELSERARRDLVLRADGNFLFATYLLESYDLAQPDVFTGESPRDLEDLYLKDLKRLTSRLEREGVRSGLGPLLAALCVAREPITLSILARAARLPTDEARDLLNRLRSFVRPDRDGDRDPRYAPYHLSFSDTVLSGRGGLGISPEAAHRRLFEALIPSAGEPWNEVSDYAVKHVGIHAAATGSDAATLMGSLIGAAAYLVLRAERIGPEALAGDLLLAKAAGCKPGHLVEIVAELALRADNIRSSHISMAQGLSVVAGAVGDTVRAGSFAALATAPLVAVPLWSAGMEGARISAGGFRSPGTNRNAALVGDGLLTLLKSDCVELWRIRDRVRIARLRVGTDARLAMAEPDGAAIWIAKRNGDSGNVLQRLGLSDGDVLSEVRLEQEIRSIRVSGDGTWIAIGTDVGRLLLLGTSDGVAVARAEVGGLVAAMRFDGERLAVLTQGRKLSVWRTPTLDLEALVVLRETGRTIDFIERTFGLELTPDFAAIGCVDGSVTRVAIEDDGSQLPLASIGAWADELGLVGDHVVVGDSNGRLHFLDRQGENNPIAFRAHASPVMLVGPHPEPGLTVSVAEDGDVAFWNEPRADAIGASGHAAEVADIGFGDSDELLSLGADGSLIRWSEAGKVAQSAYLDPATFTGLGFSQDLSSVVIERENRLERKRINCDGHLFLSATPFAPVIIDKCKTLFTPKVRRIFVSDNGALAIRGGGNGVEIWDLERPRLLFREEGLSATSPVALSSDGAYLAFQRDDGLWLRALGSDNSLRQVPTGSRVLHGPFWTSHGHRMVTCADDDVFCLCVDTMTVVDRWKSIEGAPDFVATSPDGAILSLFCRGGIVDFRGADGSRNGGVVIRPAPTVAAFSRDGSKLAIGDAGGGVTLLRLERAGIGHA